MKNGPVLGFRAENQCFWLTSILKKIKVTEVFDEKKVLKKFDLKFNTPLNCKWEGFLGLNLNHFASWDRLRF